MGGTKHTQTMLTDLEICQALYLCGKKSPGSFAGRNRIQTTYLLFLESAIDGK